MCALVALVLALAAAASASPLTVTMDRLRWSTGGFLGLFAKHHENPDYPEWRAAGVPDSHRDQTYISVVWSPPVASIRSVVVAIAGQQVALFPATQSALCGNPADFMSADLWAGHDASRPLELMDGSFATRVIRELPQGLSPENTFFALVHNAMFNWESVTKDHTVRAFTNWVVRRAGGQSARPGLLVLAGASRGGALSLRLARSLRGTPTFADSRLLLNLVDAVPNDVEGELQTSLFGARCTNPLDSSKQALHSDLVKVFAGVKPPTAARHVVTGSGVVFDKIAHGLCADDTIAWYNQTWSALSHGAICHGMDGDSGPFVPAILHDGADVGFEWLAEYLRHI